MQNKIIGSIFILTGSAVGAGMLALPMVSAPAGFFYASILLVLCWLLMTITALLILEVTLCFEPNKNTLGTITKKLLNKPMRVFVWISNLLLLYASTTAYICGSSSLLNAMLLKLFNFKLPFEFNLILVVLILGGIVYLGTHAVDYSVRLLLSAKILLLVLVLLVLVPYVDFSKLFSQSFSAKYLWVSAPIFLNAFGFHCVIPSIVNYSKQSGRVLFWIIVVSTTIPLFVYIIWLFITCGIIPMFGESSFFSIVHDNTSVGGLINVLAEFVTNKYVRFSIDIFSNIAMSTSFLGVALGLFDFLADGFKIGNSYSGRFKTIILTFFPPVLFALFYQDGFILALEYSAFFAVILEIFLPVFLVYKVRRDGSYTFKYNVPINIKVLAMLLPSLGLLIMGVVVLERLNMLPVFGV